MASGSLRPPTFPLELPPGGAVLVSHLFLCTGFLMVIIFSQGLVNEVESVTQDQLQQ